MAFTALAPSAWATTTSFAGPYSGASQLFSNWGGNAGLSLTVL